MSHGTPALQPAPAFLEAWDGQERHKPWLLPLLIACGGALVVVLVLALSADTKQASGVAPTKSAAAAVPAAAPKVDPAPSPAVVAANVPAQAAEAPTEAVVPSEVEPKAEPTAVRHVSEAPRARDNAARRRARSSSVREEVDEGPEVAATPEPPAATVIAAPPVPSEVDKPAIAAAPAVEPPPKPVEPAPAPSVAAGPTRAAVVIEQGAPRFPVRAKRLGVDRGEVTVEFTIDKDGAVKDAVVVAAEPERVFEKEALKAVAQWRYQPKLVDGTPTATRQRFTFHFR